MIWTRLSALIVKELLAAFRDPKARMALIVPPLLILPLHHWSNVAASQPPSTDWWAASHSNAWRTADSLWV